MIVMSQVGFKISKYTCNLLWDKTEVGKWKGHLWLHFVSPLSFCVLVLQKKIQIKSRFSLYLLMRCAYSSPSCIRRSSSLAVWAPSFGCLQEDVLPSWDVSEQEKQAFLLLSLCYYSLIHAHIQGILPASLSFSV